MHHTCRLSVNINKIALLRNARGGNNPDLLDMTRRIISYGAQGITLHPRPDERHTRYADVPALKAMLGEVELNIEGYPDERWMDMVLKTRPAQATLVPDAPDALTSSAGWDTLTRAEELARVLEPLKAAGIRTSLFIDADPKQAEGAARLGADRVELYTGPYANHYASDREKAIAPFITAAEAAKAAGLGINAGHDLSLDNLNYLATQIPVMEEVSIGHALICDALTFGMENVVRMYLRQLSSV